MVTATSLKLYTLKDLAQMAKSRGVQGWYSMRKDQLVLALIKAAKLKSTRSGQAGGKRNSSAADTKSAAARRSSMRKSNGSARDKTTSNWSDKSSAMAKATTKHKSQQVVRQLQQAHHDRERFKDLSVKSLHGKMDEPTKDRAILMVRDPYWLHAYWELTRQSVERARAAMAEHWHVAKPTLRLLHLEAGVTTDSSQRVAREIEIHGGVKNWYIDVQQPPQCFCVEIGYLAPGGRFYSLARSNKVTTPSPGNGDEVDQNWSDVADNYEKIYALSGGYTSQAGSGELQETFEQQLHRPMGSPLEIRYGSGAQRILKRTYQFDFEVVAEMVVTGTTRPDAFVTLAGEPIKLRGDGSFAVRLNMPDKRQVIPIVAQSSDGAEQRTIVLAVERNTKVMEPVHRDPVG